MKENNKLKLKKRWYYYYDVDEQAPAPVIVSISATKTVTSYKLNAQFATDDVTVTATWSDGTTSVVTGWTTDIPDMTTTGTKTLHVYYEEFTAEIEITVRHVLYSINWVKTVMEYYVGDTINYDDITVTAKYNEGDHYTEEIVTGWTHTEPSTATAGSVALKVTYSEDGTTKSKSKNLTISVRETYPSDYYSTSYFMFADNNVTGKYYIISPSTDLTQNVPGISAGYWVVNQTSGWANCRCYVSIDGKQTWVKTFDGKTSNTKSNATFFGTDAFYADSSTVIERNGVPLNYTL